MNHANIIWFEIPVKNLNRAMEFYEELLGIKLEKKTLHKIEYGMFPKKNTGIGGVLVEKPEQAGKGVSLFFFVNVLSDALTSAMAHGGKVITPKTILKQINQEGQLILAQNLIDNQVGYFAEILDSEGNQLALYSHN
ncbi:MAG TPA: VOC family protein [Bacteroidia bacterium]